MNNNKIRIKLLSICMSVVAMVTVLQACAKQQAKQVVETPTSSHYSGNDFETNRKDDEQVATYTLYEYIKENVLAETSLNGRIGDVVELPVNEEYATNSTSAMNGKYDSTIKGFKDDKAVLRGIAYVDADGNFKTTWENGVRQQDLDLSYNEEGYELIAYALSEVDSNTVKAWTSHPNGLNLVQKEALVTTDSVAPSDDFKFIDSYVVTGNYNDKLGLHKKGYKYILRKN